MSAADTRGRRIFALSEQFPLEVPMTTTSKVATETDSPVASAPSSMPMRFEVAVLPVADVDRARTWCCTGWRVTPR
jgi:hypothetical protein